MARLSSLFVEAFRFACGSARVTDEILSRLGLRRRYYGQKGQDRWVIERAAPGRRNGYFVEIGAGDGRTHSNTFALERDHGWTGLLIEPNPAYAATLRRMRKGTLVPTCVDRDRREADFLALGYLGGLIGEDTDHAPSRRASLLKRHANKIVRLSCRSLAEILDAEAAPPVIDYLSIDVEGAELRILESFPFDRFTFSALTVERPTKRVHDLLTEAGYVLDHVRLYDGFYLSRTAAARLKVRERPFAGVPRKFF